MKNKVRLHTVTSVVLQIIEEGTYMHASLKYRLSPRTIRDIFMDHMFQVGMHAGTILGPEERGIHEIAKEKQKWREAVTKYHSYAKENKLHTGTFLAYTWP